MSVCVCVVVWISYLEDNQCCRSLLFTLCETASCCLLPVYHSFFLSWFLRCLWSLPPICCRSNRNTDMHYPAQPSLMQYLFQQYLDSGPLNQMLTPMWQALSPMSHLYLFFIFGKHYFFSSCGFVSQYVAVFLTKFITQLPINFWKYLNSLLNYLITYRESLNLIHLQY